MTNTDEAPTLKSRGGAYVGYVLIALVLYVLSSGPALLLGENGYLSHEVFETIYYPIACIVEVFPFLHDPTDWYLSFWDR